ncbi:unnamed protein product [Adineta steineri]|uniref:G-protein coupled receptors family 1 profile domain-containing protein n=1 Tax=Adineta steineri TaxID=433720 RepID=A0A816CT26_9BILA|nr:unnamed protein product [Adineta steineri]CAF1629322.1 unnamed protein product [Adineta steineri]
MATNTTSVYLDFITRELNRYIPLPALILGTIGNLLNIMVFSRSSVRKNPCSLYFISGSIANFLSLYIGLITPFLALYNLDFTQQINILCKIRFYLRFNTITLSTWYILFASIDRFLSTSMNVRYRSWSSIHIAKRIITLASIICFIFLYTQVFYCYSINQKNVCTYSTNLCKLSVDIVLLICNSGIPPILMILISILTIKNVKHSNQINSHQRRRDRQITRILFIQVIILVLCATPITAQKLYSYATMFIIKDQLRTSIDNLISQITTEISYINNSATFYIYSLTSKKFRTEVRRVFSSLFTGQICKTNTVQPIPIKMNSNANRITVYNDYQCKPLRT